MSGLYAQVAEAGGTIRLAGEALFVSPPTLPLDLLRRCKAEKQGLLLEVRAERAREAASEVARIASERPDIACAHKATFRRLEWIWREVAGNPSSQTIRAYAPEVVSLTTTVLDAIREPVLGGEDLVAATLVEFPDARAGELFAPSAEIDLGAVLG